jgi:hypothetical protein
MIVGSQTILFFLSFHIVKWGYVSAQQTEKTSRALLIVWKKLSSIIK